MNLNFTTPNQNKKANLLTTATSWMLLVVTALLPILILPFTGNFISETKLYLIIWATLLLGLAFFFRSFRKNSWEFVLSPTTLPLFLFAASTLASILFTQNYPVENLLGVGGVYLGLSIIGLLAPSLTNKSSAKLFTKILTVTAVILSITSLLETVGWGPSSLLTKIVGIRIESSNGFSLAGSSLVAIQFLAMVLVGQLVEVIKNKKISAFHVITIPLVIFGLGLNVWTTFISGETLNINPLSSSWSIAIDSLRTPKSALIGQGPAGYSNAYNIYKPNWINGKDFWQTTFNTGANLPLALIVQVGLVGLAAWILLVIGFLRKIKDKNFRSSPLTWMLLTTFIFQLILPPNYLLLGIQGLLLAFWAVTYKKYFPSFNLSPLSINLEKTNQANADNEKSRFENLLNLLVNGSLTIGVLALFYFTGKTYASSYHMLESQKALIENDGVAVYNHQSQTVFHNPYLDYNRRSYALTNLQIALALSSKTDATDEEQNQVTQLVQQAVREARAATNIDPNDAANWRVLGQVYQELIGGVEEADQWATNAYVSAIQKAPTDPMLRMNLAGIFANQEKVEQAANLYSQAIQLKPDLPSPYFYLGQIQQQQEQFVQAKQSWQTALQLLDKDSADYQTLKQGIEQLDEVIKQANEATQTKANQQQIPEQPAQKGNMENLEKQTPLGEELPSITDQNLQETDENTVSNPEAEPLELSNEAQEAINDQPPMPEDPEEEVDAEIPSPPPENSQEADYAGEPGQPTPTSNP
ncbi:MAG: tetratricopeptide repeat protein [Patescibacteria group bacterium]|nr:tetratricopeptide repeat protein [Patescibacteria group bacterium]